MGYQKKGYTSGKIAIAWIKDWDKLTRDKVNGQYQLLIVVGHSSHFTVGFLKYACEALMWLHIFSSLKRAWSDERNKFEQMGPAVSKVNFLCIYAKAHVHAFTPKNIISAFKKTGVVPYNPNFITDVMMAPSLETSISSLLLFLLLFHTLFHFISNFSPWCNDRINVCYYLHCYI